ncbi:hypothetical protein ABIC94_003958 [Variovorax paradoxus]|uniref:hypothetical protein n=1 Tax=Variovorax paradoxus TaxID=34073 RepID=UPI00339AE281
MTIFGMAPIFCCGANAQEVSAFLRDVIRGSPQARIELEGRIYHLQVARELASRTLLLNKCPNFRETPKNPRFDDFAEALLKSLGASDPNSSTLFTVHPQLQDAVIQNRLSDAQIELISTIMRSPGYGEFVEYLSFERAELEIAAGFVDVNTGKRAPWIAARALAFLRKSQFYPLLVANSSAFDRTLLNSRLLDSIRPSDGFSDEAYLDALTAIFEKEVDSHPLRSRLPPGLQRLLVQHDSLGLDAMRGDAVLATDAVPVTPASCSARTASSCVDASWLARMAASKREFEATQYENAGLILKERFSDLCQVKPR